MMNEYEVRQLLNFVERMADAMERTIEIHEENLILNRAFLSERQADRALADLMASNHLHHRLQHLRRCGEGGFKVEPMSEREVADLAARDAAAKNLYEDCLWAESKRLAKLKREAAKEDDNDEA